MAINDNEKVDFLLKKFAYEISKTDLGSRKDPANEIIPSPLVVNSKNVWMQEIPLSSGDTRSYINRHLIQLNSGTVRTNDGYVPTWTANNSGNWISSTYGNDYVPKFYVGPIGQSTTTSLTAIVPGGTGNSDAFFFDYSAGVLHFAEDNVPSLLRSTNLTNAVYIQAFRYTGTTANSAFAGTGILVNDGSGVFSARTLSSGSNIVLSNADGKDGNPTIGLSSSVTGLNNLTSTSGVFSNKLAVSGSLTLNGRDITTSIEAIQNTNTANFSLSVGSVTDVGSNGGPSYYGTFDQGGNVREIMHSGSTATVAIRGGNFASDDQLVNTYRSSQTPTAEAPGFGFRLSSRENIGKSYPLTFNGDTITVSGSVIHGFQLGDPLKFANDTGLPVALSSGVTYYVTATGSTTFSVGPGNGGAAISVIAVNGTTSAYSPYDYSSFVRVENSGNNANAGYGAVNYNYRIGKFEVTNDEYVEFLNAVARDDHDAANNFVDNVDMGLYSLLMETEAPNNGISRNASFPDYYYASLRGMNKKPVVFVSYMDAARYANWLHNGKPVSARYRVCSIVTGMSSTATVTLANHGYSNGDLITFNCTDTSTFDGTLTRNTTFKVANVATNAFDVHTTLNANVTFTGTGTFYVKRFFDKTTNVDGGAHTIPSRNASTAIAKSNTARYWVSTENEWYKAAYYDPDKNGVGVHGYWSYPTRSDTVPTPVSADSDGNGSYNGGGTIPSHNHSSYDISDFVDRIGGILDDGTGTQVAYNSTTSSIVVNVTGIPLSTVKDVTATATEVNYLSGIVLGSGKASTVLALDTNKNISGINNLTAGTGIFTSGSFAASLSADSASTLMVGGTGVSLSGHKHYYTPGVGFNDIPNFCSGVADCLDTSLSASTGIIFNYSSNAINVSLSGQALALHNLSSNGIIVRSGIGVVTSRTITSGVNINITNGDGVSGNPTVSLAVSVTGLNDLTVDQIKIDGSTISTTGNNDSITLAPNGTGDVNIDADTLRVGDSNNNVTITTNGTGDLTLNTNSGTNSSSITIADAANGDIALSANGAGKVKIDKADITGGTINGTTIGSGTAASGNFTAVTVDNTKIDADKIYYNNTARIELGASDTVVNSPEVNVNFRVAGSGSSATNLLFVDAANNRVGIGTNSPSSLFSVSGAVNFNSTITAPNIGASTSSDSIVTLDNGLLKTRTVDSRVWGTPSSLVDGDGSAGRISYWSDSNSLTQSSNLFWDSGNSRLGIGTTSPQYLLDVRGDSYISGNLIVGNNLTISGTTVVANVDTMTVKDPIINLGLTQGNTIADTDYDRGLALSLSSTRTAFMGWDTSDSEFVMLSSGVPGTASGTYLPGTYGAFRAGTINSTGSFNGRVLNVTGTLNTAAGANNGQINLYGSNGNFISWNTNGQGAPTTTVRSSGTKLVFYPSLAGGNTDTAIGTDNDGQTLWHSIKTGSQASFKWYIGSTEKANLDNSGNFATSGTITSNGAGGFTGNGSSITGVNAYGLNVYSNSLTDTVTSLVMVTGTGTGNLRPFIDSGLKFNANTNSLILENISGTLSTIFNSTTYNSVFTATSISGLAAFGSNNESYLLNFIIDGGTP